MIDDPFENDPKRDNRLVMHSERPYNAETPAEELGTFLTPTETFYVRHHMWAPKLDAATHKLVTEWPDGEEKEYSMEELKDNFEAMKITATL